MTRSPGVVLAGQSCQWRPDVAIWGLTNPRAGVNLRGIAQACVAAGLRTTLLWREYVGRAALTPEDYPVDGLQYLHVPLRFNFGLLHYPQPLALPLLLREVQRRLKELAPRVIITQLDHVFAHRVWQYAARRLNIPGIVVQEGMTNVPKVSLAGRPIRKRRGWTWGEKSWARNLVEAIPHPLLHACAPYMFAEYACVWGAAMKRHLMTLGRSERTIFVTGSPAFDHIVSRRPLVSAQNRTVLFAQQRMNLSFGKRKAFYEQLIRVVTKDLSCRLLFKLHPNSFHEAGMVRALGAGGGCQGDLLEVIDAGDAVDLLDRACVAVVASSTTAYHAAVLGVPLVVAEYCSDDIRFDIGDSGGAAVAQRPEDLSETLRRAVFETSFREQLYEGGARLIEDHLLALDGRGSERVAEVVQRLLEERRCQV